MPGPKKKTKKQTNRVGYVLAKHNFIGTCNTSSEEEAEGETVLSLCVSLDQTVSFQEHVFSYVCRTSVRNLLKSVLPVTTSLMVPPKL